MKTKRVKCSQCGVEFDKPIAYIKQGEKRGYPNHFCSNKCSTEFNRILNIENAKKREEKYYKDPKKCLNCNSPIRYDEKSRQKYCSSKCAATHTQRNGGHKIWTEEDKKKLSEKMGGKCYPRRKYPPKTPKPKIKIRKECKFCKQIYEFFYSPSRSRSFCSKKCYSDWAKETGFLKGRTGGYREKGGRGKQGWYKGYYCNSSWELAWVIYNLDNGIKFQRNTRGFKYTFNKREYNFYPDFRLDNGDYVEVKGYLDGKQKAKIRDFPKKLEVVGKEEIKPFVEYAENKYGKNFIDVYEKRA